MDQRGSDVIKEERETLRCLIGGWGQSQSSPGHRDVFRRGLVRWGYSCCREWSSVTLEPKGMSKCTGRPSVRNTKAEPQRQMSPGEEGCSHGDNLCGSLGPQVQTARALQRGFEKALKSLEGGVGYISLEV